MNDVIVTIIDEEEARCHERIQKRVQPIVQKEFDRMKKRYPDLVGITFGNGSYYIDFKEGTKYAWKWSRPELPKAFAKLEEICVQVCTYAEDVRASGTPAKAAS